MKKILICLTAWTLFIACNNNPGESGAVNDGFKGGADPNGALPDSAGLHTNPAVDTAIGDNRVDTEKRDSIN